MKKAFFFFTLYMVTLNTRAYCQKKTPIVAGKNIAIVQTAYGMVRGYIHNGIFTFKGIPYGKAERFMPAEKPAQM